MCTQEQVTKNKDRRHHDTTAQNKNKDNYHTTFKKGYDLNRTNLFQSKDPP